MLYLFALNLIKALYLLVLQLLSIGPFHKPNSIFFNLMLRAISSRDIADNHYSDVIISTWRLKSPANRLFTRRFVQVEIKENRVTGLYDGNSPATGEFPAQRASNAAMFPFDDVIMNAKRTFDDMSFPSNYVFNNEVEAWKLFPRDWSFVRGTCHRWNPLTKASNAGVGASFNISLNTRLNKQSSCMWFETPCHSLWRHCNVSIWCQYYNWSGIAIILSNSDVNVSIQKYGTAEV